MNIETERSLQVDKTNLFMNKLRKKFIDDRGNVTPGAGRQFNSISGSSDLINMPAPN